MKLLIIFIITIILFMIDKFPVASVATAGCIAMVLFGICTPTEMMSGFTNDIVLIVFGTEILGTAFNESGVSSKISKLIIKITKENEKKLILFAGLIAAVLSAFLNNQVVCSFMMIICIHISKTVKEIHVRNVTLPVIYCAIMGGQCTLVGAPATLIASSVAENITGNGFSMFELLPMGLILLIIGLLWIYFVSYQKSGEIWGNCEQVPAEPEKAIACADKKKMIVTLLAGVVMILLFITNLVSVGTASVISGLICIFGGAVSQKKAFEKLDWNILIWLACSISMASALNQSGSVQEVCDFLVNYIPSDISPVLLLSIFTILSVIISNFIANTTTVIMLLPFALQLAETYSLNPASFLVAVTMGAGLAILTPLSSGFIGMTVRVGYRFQDYVRYGVGIQILLTAMIIVLTCMFYPITA